MKKVAIAISVLAALGSAAANANVVSASTTLTKNVPQVCNIGLWATGSDGSVGGDVADLGSDYVHSELNDLKTTGQTITGKAKCNSAGGYTVHVIPTHGKLKAFDSSGSPIPNADLISYTLEEKSSSNFNPSGTLVAPIEVDAGVPLLVGNGVNTDIATFKLLMKSTQDFTYAGQYTETLTFDLTPL